MQAQAQQAAGGGGSLLSKELVVGLDCRTLESCPEPKTCLTDCATQASLIFVCLFFILYLCSNVHYSFLPLSLDLVPTSFLNSLICTVRCSLRSFFLFNINIYSYNFPRSILSLCFKKFCCVVFIFIHLLVFSNSS